MTKLSECRGWEDLKEEWRQELGLTRHEFAAYIFDSCGVCGMKETQSRTCSEGRCTDFFCAVCGEDGTSAGPMLCWCEAPEDFVGRLRFRYTRFRLRKYV